MREDTPEDCLPDFLMAMIEGMDAMSIPVVGGHTVSTDDIIYTLILVEIIPRSKARVPAARPLVQTISEQPLAGIEEDRMIRGNELQGCAAKYPAQKLEGILEYAISQVPAEKRFANLRVKDDVVLYHLDEDRAVAFSVDVIKPMINSADFLGRVAVVHAASDLSRRTRRCQTGHFRIWIPFFRRQGSRLLRASTVSRFEQASREPEIQCQKTAEEHFLQAQNSGSEAEIDDALKDLEQVRKEQAQKLTDIALEAKAQQEALQQLQGSGPLRRR